MTAEQAPHKPLLRPAHSYNLSRLQDALAECAVGHTLEYHERVTSTMPIAHQRALDTTVRSGTVILTDEQTAGRGRQTRRWETPPRQALLLSIIFKRPFPLAVHEFSMAAGVAAVQAVTTCWPELEGQVGLKWPNDLLLGSAMTNAGKFGGILVENSFYGATLSHAIVGMGINVLQSEAMLPPALPGAPPPTSLAHYLSAVSDNVATAGMGGDRQLWREELLIALCQAWATLLQLPSESPAVQQRWRSLLWTLGQQVTIHQEPAASDAPGATIAGEAIDVTPEGLLVLRDHTGTIQHFAAGDVSVRLTQPSATGGCNATQ